MKCIVCDRCKSIIEDARRCRVITCARPLKSNILCGNNKIPYRGDDPRQNDLIWEKEICDDCRAALEAFFDAGKDAETNPPADDDDGEGTEEDDEQP